jgi:5-methylcytosine-specific restriction endonuclease McrA
VTAVDVKQEWQELPSSRAEALSIGAKTYFDGKPCRNGHVGPRRADEAKCVACINERANRRRKEKPEHVGAIAKAFRERHPERVKAWKLRYYEGNKEAILGARKLRYAADPEIRARVRARNDAWAKANPERKREVDRRWVQENRERHNENGKRWKTRNPDLVRIMSRRAYLKDKSAHYKRQRDWLAKNPHKSIEYCSARRARLLAAEGRFTNRDFIEICAKQKGRCAACRKKRKLTADHIIALSRGGSNHPSNIQGLCHSCNSTKHARDPIDFMQEKGFLL